jgi:hypothetical protein
MGPDRVEILAKAFDTSKRSEIAAAWELAKPEGDQLLADLAQALPRIGKSDGRASILRYVGRFARTSEVAFKMGLAAVQDRSYAVRHYGCALLAYSLRSDALPAISLLLKHPDRKTVEDAKAAIDAIRQKKS